MGSVLLCLKLGFFFFTKTREKGEEINLYTLDLLRDISGVNDLFVDNRFLSIIY